MKITMRRVFVIAIAPMLVVTGFWNWTRDQVRSEPVNTVPHQQSSSEVQMSQVGVSSFRRVSPAIVAWEERRSQAADLAAAVNTIGDEGSDRILELDTRPSALRTCEHSPTSAEFI